MAALAQEPEDIKDMEAFLKMAKYPLVKHTDMTTEMREEAMDTCITAVEKHHADMEKCTQVSLIATTNWAFLLSACTVCETLMCCFLCIQDKLRACR